MNITGTLPSRTYFLFYKGIWYVQKWSHQLVYYLTYVYAGMNPWLFGIIKGAHKFFETLFTEPSCCCCCCCCFLLQPAASSTNQAEATIVKQEKTVSGQWNFIAVLTNLLLWCVRSFVRLGVCGCCCCCCCCWCYYYLGVRVIFH